MADHPLRPATDRRLGGPLPHQLANQTRIHLMPSRLFTQDHAVPCAYAALAVISNCYSPVYGRLPTRYSPVRRSVSSDSIRKLPPNCFARLACVRHAASVHPEPGSNSHINRLSGSKLSLADFCSVSLLGCCSEFFLKIQGLTFAFSFGIFRVLHTV